MGNKGRSERGLFGDIHHYDEHGKKIGTSRPGLFGSYTNYDAKGNKVGHSDPGFFGSYNHYDAKGKKTGHSDPGLFGSYNHYDSKNKSSGHSDPGMFGSYNHNSSGGCYVATCVYGSYNCPEVWMLRRYRDNYLAKSYFGRIFIKVYYAVSPKIVKAFGNANGFRRFWRSVLNKKIIKLQKLGYESTPYEDKKY